MNNKWKNNPLMHKIVTVFSIIVSIAVVILAILQIFNIWNTSVNVLVPLLGVNLLCQAYTQWNINRKIAYFDIAVAAFVLACSIVVFFVK